MTEKEWRRLERQSEEEGCGWLIWTSIMVLFYLVLTRVFNLWG